MPRRVAALLNRVDQLVRDQSAASLGYRVKRAAAENDVLADSVGVGAQRGSRFGRARVHMDADVGEIVSEAPFQFAAKSGFKRFAAPRDVLVQRRGRGFGIGRR
jgi:hypothetical protein